MTEAYPGNRCPKTGTWTPSGNPHFYPEDYSQKVMNRHFEAGTLMPATPHGERSWILREQGMPIENFSGLSPEQIQARISKKGAT